MIVVFDILPPVSTNSNDLSSIQAANILTQSTQQTDSYLLRNGTWTRYIDPKTPLVVTTLPLKSCRDGKQHVTCPEEIAIQQQERRNRLQTGASTSSSTATGTSKVGFFKPLQWAILGGIVAAGFVTLAAMVMMYHRKKTRVEKDHVEGIRQQIRSIGKDTFPQSMSSLPKAESEMMPVRPFDRSSMAVANEFEAKA